MHLFWSLPAAVDPATHVTAGKETVLDTDVPGIAYAIKVTPGLRIRALRLRDGIVEGERAFAWSQAPVVSQVESALHQWHVAFFGTGTSV